MSTKHTGAMAIALALAVWAPATAEPIDFRPGDLTRFLDARAFAMPLPEDLEEIIVNGRRPEPLPEHKVIPSGLGALVYALKNPTKAWRILVPDPNVWIADRSPDDLVEPPGAYRARILAPGRIYD
jgi:hypothetical protein